MKRFFFLLVVAVFTLGMQAQTAREEIKANRFLSASNYLDYNNQLSTETLTPAPKGYEPFYLTHYGRHGSRWLIGKQEYDAPLNTLREAHRHGKLTAKGEEVLKKFEAFYPTTINRLGELTTVGERQHHGIGKRMAQNFPEIFQTKNVPIDARSTVVIRCILSMEAECEELAAANPTARFHNDVSESFQYYLNAPWEGQVRKNAGKGREELSKFRYENTHPDRLMKVLFNDQDWVYNNVQAGNLMRQLFDVASNMQSHDTDIELYSLFNDDEVYDLWRVNNAGWYLNYGAAPQTGGIMPFSQLNLLKNLIATADTITTTQATLRFGHEVCVLPLACLLELGNCGVAVNDLNKLDEQWRNYRIFPMACNIQIIFYRPKKGKSGDVLVKAMLNEREVSLPVKTDQYPYYKWNDVRQYYMDKIAKYEANE
ncbi:MAG: histidine-type phosphatase [Phocaeicola sp.]|nr:histidine-type phosphatase [Phocaeicola sp.]